jgi:Fic family protein
MKQESNRAGVYVRRPTGYSAFVPKPLPPSPAVALDDELLELLSRADRALGRLDGSTEALPNPDLFVMMYVRKEAVLSSQIEGTQASLADVLELEAKVLDPSIPADVAEVVNYVNALNYGIERVKTLPLSLRLVSEIHARLMEGTRGQERNPGDFRRSQNWIGPAGCNLNTARFIPPAPDDMKAALGEWENFLHDERPMPIMLKVGLAHAQFETIHPFLDGNGRVGRLLVTFLLCERNVLIRPLLYLSHYFKLNRLEYYDRLQAVREKGDWEGWLKFFLRGVATVADEAATTARRIVALREEQREQIRTSFGRTTPDALQLHEQLFQHPFVTITLVQQMTGKEFPAASRLVKQMVQLEILKQVSGKARNRVFLHDRYFRMFDDSEVEAQDVASDLVEETLVRESPL